MVPNSLPPVELKLASNSVDVMCEARVIFDAQGVPATLILSNKALGVELKLPARAWPFVEGKHPVIVSLCVFQAYVDNGAAGLQLIKAH